MEHRSQPQYLNLDPKIADGVNKITRPSILDDRPGSIAQCQVDLIGRVRFVKGGNKGLNSDRSRSAWRWGADELVLLCPLAITYFCLPTNVQLCFRMRHTTLAV